VADTSRAELLRLLERWEDRIREVSPLSAASLGPGIDEAHLRASLPDDLRDLVTPSLVTWFAWHHGCLDEVHGMLPPTNRRPLSVAELLTYRTGMGSLEPSPGEPLVWQDSWIPLLYDPYSLLSVDLLTGVIVRTEWMPSSNVYDELHLIVGPSLEWLVRTFCEALEATRWEYDPESRWYTYDAAHISQDLIEKAVFVNNP
jgi:hypothetical protein